MNLEIFFCEKAHIGNAALIGLGELAGGTVRVERPVLVGSADDQGNEAEGEDGVFEGGTEVLPERRLGTGIVGGEEEEEHHGEAAEASPADHDAGEETDGDEQLGEADDGGEDDGMGEDQVSQKRLHEGVGALIEEAADVRGHAATPDKAGAGEFVLGEDEEDEADGDAQEGECFGLLFRSAHLDFC